MCFDDQTTALDFLGDASLVCDVSVSQTVFKDIGGLDDPTCNVCGDGKSMTLKDAMFDASLFGFGQVRCGDIEALGLSGQLPTIPGVSCAALANLLGETCGCTAPSTASPTPAPTLTPTHAPTPPVVTPAPPTSSPASSLSSSNSNDGISSFGIVGIVIGSLVGLVIVVLAVWMTTRSQDGGARTTEEKNSSNEGQQASEPLPSSEASTGSII